jgi:hypothetical protein
MDFRSRAVAVGLAALLAGCSSSSGSGSTITVSGTVVDLSGQPYPGQTVILSSGSFTQTETTDAGGAFSVEGVPRPYMATVVAGGGEFVSVYQGLTRVDPTLTGFFTPHGGRASTLTGQFTGGSPPGTVGDSTSFVFASAETVQDFIEFSSDYHEQLRWSGPSTTTGTLYAIQVHLSEGVPTDYPGYGTRDNVALEDTGTLTGQDVALASVTTGTLSGTVTTPVGYSLAALSLQLLVAPTVALNLLNFAQEPPSAPTFSLATPSIDGTSVLLGFSATPSSTGESAAAQMAVSANASGVTLTVPAAPTLNLPEDGATGVTDSTAFAWTAFPSGVHLLQVFGGDRVFVLFTSASTTTLGAWPAPNTPPTSTAYTWNVMGLAPVPSVDAMAAAGGLNQFLFSNFTEGQSASRTFTTAP